MKTSIIISPSGNFYGSERTLTDFLSSCQNKYIVYIPKKSILSVKINILKSKHLLRYYNLNNIPFLYLKVVYHIIFQNINSVYINEAGHSKYIRLLSYIFSNIKFIN